MIEHLNVNVSMMLAEICLLRREGQLNSSHPLQQHCFSMPKGRHIKLDMFGDRLYYEIQNYRILLIGVGPSRIPLCGILCGRPYQKLVKLAKNFSSVVVTLTEDVSVGANVLRLD